MRSPASPIASVSPNSAQSSLQSLTYDTMARSSHPKRCASRQTEQTRQHRLTGRSPYCRVPLGKQSEVLADSDSSAHVGFISERLFLHSKDKALALEPKLWFLATNSYALALVTASTTLTWAKCVRNSETVPYNLYSFSNKLRKIKT